MDPSEKLHNYNWVSSDCVKMYLHEQLWELRSEARFSAFWERICQHTELCCFLEALWMLLIILREVAQFQQGEYDTASELDSF